MFRRVLLLLAFIIGSRTLSERWRDLIVSISLRDRIRNYEICTRTKVTDIALKICKLNWQWTGNIVRIIINRWRRKVLEWWPRLNKRSTGRLPNRWTKENGRKPLDIEDTGASGVASIRGGLHQAVEFFRTFRPLGW